MNSICSHLAPLHIGLTAALLATAVAALPACSQGTVAPTPSESEEIFTEEPYDVAPILEDPSADVEGGETPESLENAPAQQDTESNPSSTDVKANADTLKKELDITEDFRDNFIHGDKPLSHQRYIVLHDTESDADAQSVIDWWDSNGNLVAAHFVVNKDGSIWQCAPLDSIVHHAGFGDTGHNEKYGTVDESYDDKRGTTPIGDWASDYGMNSYSIGIEMVHAGGEGSYPEAQLQAVDGLIAYLDAYYGYESEIIDHKAWRSGNSDTSEEFAEYLAHYQDHRTHSGN